MKSKKFSLMIMIVLAVLVSCKKDKEKPFVNHTGEVGTVTDIDGNTYATIGIGGQIWMAENLRVTHYRDNTPIPEVTDNTQWNSLTSGAYGSYNNDISISGVYGFLYNWYAVKNSRNIAPVGWHVPTRDEWETLIDWLGGEQIAGLKLKEAGTTHWNSGNTSATNSSGFTALPAGWRLNLGDYFYMNSDGYWWSVSTDYLPPSMASAKNLKADSASVTGLAVIKGFGLSVRCVKDSE